MDLYLIEVDGLAVAMAESEDAAYRHARVLTFEDPTIDVRIYHVRAGAQDQRPWLPLAEAATA